MEVRADFMEVRADLMEVRADLMEVRAENIPPLRRFTPRYSPVRDDTVCSHGF
jgi:hypothetical protein